MIWRRRPPDLSLCPGVAAEWLFAAVLAERKTVGSENFFESGVIEAGIDCTVDAHRAFAAKNSFGKSISTGVKTGVTINFSAAGVYLCNPYNLVGVAAGRAIFVTCVSEIQAAEAVQGFKIFMGLIGR